MKYHPKKIAVILFATLSCLTACSHSIDTDEQKTELTFADNQARQRLIRNSTSDELKAELVRALTDDENARKPELDYEELEKFINEYEFSVMQTANDYTRTDRIIDYRKNLVRRTEYNKLGDTNQIYELTIPRATMDSYLYTIADYLHENGDLPCYN